MSEILSGARYTFGGLVVMTLWTIGMVQFVEWKMEMQAAEAVEKNATHDELRRFGLPKNANKATADRYLEMMGAGELQ